MEVANVAASVGLPVDTPPEILGFLERFVQSTDVNAGANKNKQQLTEQKNEAQKVLIAFMESRQIAYLEVKGKFLVVDDSVTPLAYSDTFIQAAFKHFMGLPHQGKTLDMLSDEFIAFCKKARTDNGTHKKSLKTQATRPVKAMFGVMFGGHP